MDKAKKEKKPIFEAKPEPVKEVPVAKAKVNVALNIRKEPSLEGKIVKAFNGGEITEIYEIQGEWARVDCGWCSVKYLTFC